MESVIGQLQKILIGSRNNLEALFAKMMIKNFQAGTFLSQKELSEELFMSESAITKICKNLGYTGFRQFNELIQIEYKKYVLDRKTKLGDFKMISKMIEKSLEDANEYSEFIDDFRREVLTKKSLTILPSYQAMNAGQFLKDYLNTKAINAKLWNSARNFIIDVNDFVDDDEPILFIFTGPDNYLNYENYSNLKNQKNHKVYVITTAGQNANFDIKLKYVLKSNVKYSNAFVREVLLELLFLEMFE